ncbi:hypothetical protein POKO110462_15300 [Pontibacter korlensis]
MMRWWLCRRIAKLWCPKCMKKSLQHTLKAFRVDQRMELSNLIHIDLAAISVYLKVDDK